MSKKYRLTTAIPSAESRHSSCDAVQKVAGPAAIDVHLPNTCDCALGGMESAAHLLRQATIHRSPSALEAHAAPSNLLHPRARPLLCLHRIPHHAGSPED